MLAIKIFLTSLIIMLSCIGYARINNVSMPSDSTLIVWSLMFWGSWAGVVIAGIVGIWQIL